MQTPLQPALSMPRPRILLCIFLLVTFALPAAAQGRIELSQAGILAAGGFPFEIDTPASYVLTTNLDVPADTDGLDLTVAGAHIDLNGFAIRGPFVCGGGAGCAGGGASAIASSQGRGQDETTIRNGRVQGFGGNCLSVGSRSHITSLIVSDCGQNGIVVLGGSLVKDNVVARTGNHGIVMSFTASPAAFAHNSISETGRDTGAEAVSGGRATAGNACDDESCQSLRRPRYYLTRTSSLGDHGASTCAPNFHMASAFELADLSALSYATDLGATLPDSGEGPPAGLFGWVRTGQSSDGFTATCDAGAGPWTSADGSQEGAVAVLNAFERQADRKPEWVTLTFACNVNAFVWCIED